MKWDADKEKQLLELRNQQLTNKQIAEILGTTVASVKHKVVRLSQVNNSDSHHHPVEKQQQIENVLNSITEDISVLETHAGYGNMTAVYSSYAKDVVCYELNKEKAKYIKDQGFVNVTCHNKDSLRESYLAVYNKDKFNVIDIDPYGFPSRYFPHIFELIDDGYMFVTLPKYGCAQINNITKMHVKSFYGFDGGSNEQFLECWLSSIKTYALRTYRSCEVLDIVDLDKVYRIALRIKKENAFVLCGYNHLAKGDNGKELW